MSAPPAELTRIERLVGEMIGLRLLLTAMLPEDVAKRRAISGAALKALGAWEIGSDTEEGAQRIRSYISQMLGVFPEPVPVVGPKAEQEGQSPRPQ